jgi:hypothetical protein
MDSLMHMFYILGMIATFILGSNFGSLFELKSWLESCESKIPIIRKGLIFKVECIGGDE